MHTLRGLSLCIFLCSANSREQIGSLTRSDANVVDLAGNQPERFIKLFRAVHYAGRRVLDESEADNFTHDNGKLLCYVNEYLSQGYV